MDAELRGKIEDLVSLCERRREEVLSDLIHAQAWQERAEVATLALSYAEWTRSLEGYRSVLQGEAERPTLRVQR